MDGVIHHVSNMICKIFPFDERGHQTDSMNYIYIYIYIYIVQMISSIFLFSIFHGISAK